MRDGVELVGTELPDPVGAPAQQFGHLGGGVRHLVQHDLADRRLALRAVGVIALVAFHGNFGNAVHPDDLVGSRSDRVLRVFLWSHLLAIVLRHHVERHRHVIERRGEHALQFHAHMRVVHLGRMIHVGVIARRRDLLVGQDRVDRVDDIVGRQLVAVVECDVLAQREFQRRLLGPFEGLGEQRLDLERLRIAIDERIPDLMAEHDAGAKLVVVGRDIGDRVSPGDAQRVGGLLRHCRHGCRRQCRRQNRSTQSLAHRHVSRALLATVGAAVHEAKRFIPNPVEERNSASAVPAARRHGWWCDRRGTDRRSAHRSAIPLPSCRSAPCWPADGMRR